MKHILQVTAIMLGLLTAPIAALAEMAPTTIDGATTVTPDEAGALFDQGVVFVDVRKGSDFDAGRIPGAVHLDSKTAFTEEALAALVGKDDPVVIYCNGVSCMRSSKTTQLAVGWGYTKVYYLRDGYPGWETAGLPVE